MRTSGYISEMASAPKTAAKAMKFNAILPANEKEAKELAARFWLAFLEGNTGADAGSGMDAKPPVLTDQFIGVKKQKGEDFGWLEWHAIATFTPISGVHFTLILTSTDEPGVYRADFVLLGQRRAFIKNVRDKVSHELMVMQDRATMKLSDDELADFDRVKISTARVRQTHREGLREDHNLVARLILDRIPMSRLPERAGLLRNMARYIGDAVIDELTSDVKAQTTETFEQFIDRT